METPRTEIGRRSVKQQIARARKKLRSDVRGNGLFDLLLGFRLYQLRLLFDLSRYRSILKSRRIGITWYMSFEMVCTASGIFDGMIHPFDYVCISRRERDAKNVIRMCKKWILTLRKDPELAAYLDTEIWSRTEIEFSRSGYRISAETQSEDAGRGDGAHVYRDELAFYRYANEIQDSATATILHDSRLRLTDCSTPQPPAGKGRLFYDICTDPRFDFYSRHKITITDAIAEGFPITLEEVKQGKNHDKVQQEFFCKFLGAGKHYLDRERLVRSRGPLPGGDYRIAVGVDVASMVDMTAITILKIFSNGTIWLSDVYTIQGLPYATWIDPEKNKNQIGQDQIVAAILRMYDPVITMFDISGNEQITGDSAKLIRMVMDLNPPGRLGGAKFTRDWKAHYVPEFRNWLEAGMFGIDDDARVMHLNNESLADFSLPSIEEQPNSVVQLCFEDWTYDIVLNDFCKVKRSLTPRGDLTYTTERDEDTGHGDVFWSFLLAFSSVANLPQKERGGGAIEYDDATPPDYSDLM